MFGPITIFDKSALEALNPDEAVWFDNFYRTTITPLFFVETLADLEKEVAAGWTPEQVVGAIASKAPVQNGLPNVHHRALAIGELLGQRVDMRFFPVIAGGRQYRPDKSAASSSMKWRNCRRFSAGRTKNFSRSSGISPCIGGAHSRAST